VISNLTLSAIYYIIIKNGNMDNTIFPFFVSGLFPRILNYGYWCDRPVRIIENESTCLFYDVF